MNKKDLKFLKKDKLNYTSEDIKLLESGYPLAYIIGYVDFINAKIDLRYKPLTPRTETEYWVNEILRKVNFLEKKFTFLDIFCGSGCIGISILQAFPDSIGIFTDLDNNAIKSTKLNLKLNKISKNNYKVIKSDLFENISDMKFDYIFANPPYVGINEKVGKEIIHEPSSAIYAKDNGMGIIKKFLKEAKSHLNENGKIFMEFGEKQKRAIRQIAESRPNFYKDQFGKDRWVEITF